MTPRAQAVRALREAQRLKQSRDTGTLGDLMAVAYMRLLVARRSGQGVRLSPDEVRALFIMDTAIDLAAENIAEEFCPTEDDS